MPRNAPSSEQLAVPALEWVYGLSDAADRQRHVI